MTPSEISSLYTESRIDSSKYGGGMVSKVKIDNFDISGNSYEVAFLFKDDKLVKVNLRLKSEHPSIYYESVKSKLCEKFGKEIYSNKSRSVEESKWVSPSGYIKLSNTNFAGNENLVIQYCKNEESGF